MHNLGQTRSSRKADHLLQTPDTFVRAPLPGMERATAVVHVSPAIGAQFTQYTAEMEAGGNLGPSKTQRFVYVLEGAIEIHGRAELNAGAYAYIPEGHGAFIKAQSQSRVAVIEKPYEDLENTPAPNFFTSHEKDAASHFLGGDPALEVRSLIPGSLEYDFAVNTMTYQLGASLSMVEIHVMEHGLLMLDGEGIYRLGDSWYPVAAGDFIWMAPYCPQWFGALGKKPARYLIYKDWNRHPLL
jgi:(S)-ureidoglycine aminohydrolase